MGTALAANSTPHAIPSSKIVRHGRRSGAAEKVQYIIVDLWRLNRYQVAFKSDRQRLERIIPQIEELYNSSEYGIIDLIGKYARYSTTTKKN